MNSDSGDVQELVRLRRLRRQLELPAYLFERYGGQCKGDCERPIAVTPTNPEPITCCNLQPSWEMYHEMRTLERALAAKVHRDRDPEPVQAPLGERYARTFTGTYVGRKLVGDDSGEVDEGETGEVQGDDGGQEERKRTR